jgi:hypothetical protein
MSYLGLFNVSGVGFGSSVPRLQSSPPLHALPTPILQGNEVDLHTQINALQHQLSALTQRVQEQTRFAPQAQTTPLVPAQELLANSSTPQVSTTSTAEAVQEHGPTPADGDPRRDPPIVSHSQPHGVESFLTHMPSKMTLSIPVPLVDPKEPFLTLRHWDSWHHQVTDPFYKNAQGSHAGVFEYSIRRIRILKMEQNSIRIRIRRIRIRILISVFEFVRILPPKIRSRIFENGFRIFEPYSLKFVV